MLSLVGSQNRAVRSHIPGPVWRVVFFVTWGFEEGEGLTRGSSGGLPAAYWASHMGSQESVPSALWNEQLVLLW